MSAAVHAEDHQGGDEAPAEVTGQRTRHVSRDMYEYFLRQQIKEHRRILGNLEDLLSQSLRLDQ